MNALRPRRVLQPTYQPPTPSPAGSLLIRRSGNLIDISPDGVSETPWPVVQLLTPSLVYTFRQFLQGQDAYDPQTGRRQQVRFEQRKLYTITTDGRLTMLVGYLSRVYHTLVAAGYSVRYCDLNTDMPRPRCYEPMPKELNARMQLRARQPECLMAMLSTPVGGVIQAVTGFGKTHTITAWCLLHPYAKVHVVVKPVDVAARITRQLTSYLGQVGQVGGGVNRPSHVTVFTAASLHLSDGDADFVLIDEVHQLLTDRYAQQIVSTYRRARIFGFSATPYSRADGAHARLEGMCGPKLFQITYAEAVELGLVAPIRVRWLPIRMTDNPAAGYTASASKKRWGLWRNQQRNAAIAAAANEYSADTQVLILVETVEHAVNLLQHLPHFTLCYGDIAAGELAAYVQRGMLPHDHPNMDGKRRTALRDQFEAGHLKKVIATDVWSTGVDFVALAVLIRGDARGSEIMDTQGPGRVSRVYADKAYGEVIDCADFFDEGLLRKAKSRRKTYASLEWEQDWPQGRNSLDAAEMRE